MKKIKLLIVILLLGCYSNSSFSQATGEFIMANSVSIYNNSTKKLTFKIGQKVEDLKWVTVKANEKWISQAFPSKPRPIFVMKTNNSEVRYNLKLNSTYILFWNAVKKYYDLKVVKTE